MAYLAEYGLFFSKVLTLFLMIMGVLVSLIGIAMRNRHAPAEQIEVRRINDRYREMADALETATLAPALAKKHQKIQKKERKAEAKAQKKCSGGSKKASVCAELSW
jgi:serine protease SohB